MAEQTVQSFKECMKRQYDGSIETHVARFPFAYRNTPHSTTVTSLTMLMFNRPFLNLLKPDIQSTVQTRQFHQKLSRDVHCKDRQFCTGDSVFSTNFGRGPEWLPGVIDVVKGPVTYLVRLTDDRIVKCHVDHIRVCSPGQANATYDDISFGLTTTSDETYFRATTS